ncbi:MAG: phenylalanine--tRNA ligase subunit alpha [Candidatus Aenigmatarchaeota archaeon]
MKMYKVTEEGKKYLEKGLPERQLVNILEKDAKLPTKEIKERVENSSIAMNWCFKNNLIEMEDGEVKLKKKPGEFHTEKDLRKVYEGEEVDEENLKRLKDRQLIEEIREDVIKKARKQLESGEISSLTPELVKSGLWKEAKLKKYNIEETGKPESPGRKHILSYYAQKIRRVFLEMGFEERKGPLVESSFWNFDALYQPQDHPARELADTFFMKKPNKTKLPEKNVVKAVKEIHERGDGESTGWQYDWKDGIAKKPILRTHTTAVSARSLKDIKPPAKIFSIGRVFRNETIDYSHLPEFTQIEGIVVDESVSFDNLLGYLKEFYNKLGFEKVRFRPAYFPYTEMSVEPEVYFEEKGEWLEMGGSGIFRPEVTRPLGIDVPVLAWGLGLERPIMLKLGINDIREFYYKNDLKLLKNLKVE